MIGAASNRAVRAACPRDAASTTATFLRRQKAAVTRRALSASSVLVESSNDDVGATAIVDDCRNSGNKARMPRLEALRDRLSSDDGVVAKFVVPEKIQAAAGNNGGCGSSKGGEDVNGNQAGMNGDGDGAESVQRLLSRLKKAQRDRPRLRDEAYSGGSEMLTDRYSRVHTYLRVSLAERCNLRCQYCMPPEGVPLQPSGSLLSNDEIMRLVTLFAREGVDKIRLTGGEPLLRKDLADLIGRISDLGTVRSVGITTNGVVLSRQLPDLVPAGLTHVNVSLDTLSEDKFVEITRRRGMDKVLRAIDDACSQLPHGRVKINCVVMKGFNDSELNDFVLLAKDRPVDVRFIEWMPFNDNGWNANRFFSYEEMLAKIREGFSLEGGGEEVNHHLARLTDGANDTTKWYQVPGHVGRIGFITSMSEHFCGTCNRLRITADGNLKVCLFGSDEMNLRDAMRVGIEDDDLSLLIGAAVRRKNFALGGHGSMHGIKEANDNRPMTLIGG